MWWKSRCAAAACCTACTQLRAPAMHASCTALAPISCCLYHQGGTTHAVCRALLHGQQAGPELQELRCGVAHRCPAL